MIAIISVLLATSVCVESESRPTVDAPDLGYAELWRLQHDFYDRWIVPNNIKEAESINSTIFAEDILGRVSDTRTFAGRELNTEYIFGLFMPSNSMSIIGQPHEYENISLPVVINTWMTWNSDLEMTQYDVIFKWFGNLFQTLVLSMGGNVEEATAKTVQKIADSICNAHERHCQGMNQQYTDWNDCYSFLTEDIRIGQSFELGMNTLMCRSVHELMVRYRPEIHCSHIGPTGGGECDDTLTYTGTVEDNLNVNSPWVVQPGK